MQLGILGQPPHSVCHPANQGRIVPCTFTPCRSLLTRHAAGNVFRAATTEGSRKEAQELWDGVDWEELDTIWQHRFWDLVKVAKLRPHASLPIPQAWS
jgi:hypothetical protein